MKKNHREHHRLLRLVKELPQDYQPWGNIDRENVDGKGKFGFDCSCGCKYYRELDGQLGMDWGVCTNPKSHRVGLLTFEHQGCPKFEQEPCNQESN
jgi:hypothetical protein